MTSLDNSDNTAPSDSSAAGDGILAIQQVSDGQGVTLVVAGELDISTVPYLKDKLSGIDHYAAGRVLLDLSELTFIDSTGLACLIAADRDARADGHSLHLRGVQGQVQMLFGLTGVGERFTFD